VSTTKQILTIAENVVIPAQQIRNAKTEIVPVKEISECARTNASISRQIGIIAEDVGMCVEAINLVKAVNVSVTINQ